jgi:hypothetical protein
MAARPGSFDELAGEHLHPPDALHQNASDVHGATGSAVGTVPAQDVAGG